MTEILINVARYKQLLRAEEKLSCLETLGVDNWSGYDEAMRGRRDVKVLENGEVVYTESEE